jgi:hypothetical protein
MPFCFEPAAPIGRFEIAHVGDRRVADVWRREAPMHHGEFALAIRRRVDNWRYGIRVNSRQGWKIARPVAHHTKGAPARRMDF